MARTTTMKISGFNVVMPPPHSPERYVEALQRAHGLRRPMKMWGDYSGLLETVHVHPDDGVVSGSIIRFFDLDLVRDWFNMETNRPASREEVNREVSIPENLKPHLTRCVFVFFPDSHMLFYVRQERPGAPSIGATQLTKFFEHLFTSWELVTEFGVIEVSAIPEMEAVEGILSHPHLRRLHIKIKLPNPDGVADASGRMAARLEAEHAKEHEEQIKAARNQYLVPDEERRLQARVAAMHGTVSADVGRRGEAMKPLSTSDKPLIETESYNPESQTLFSVLLESGRGIVQRLRRWQNGENDQQAGQSEGDGT